MQSGLQRSPIGWSASTTSVVAGMFGCRAVPTRTAGLISASPSTTAWTARTLFLIPFLSSGRRLNDSTGDAGDLHRLRVAWQRHGCGAVSTRAAMVVARRQTAVREGPVCRRCCCLRPAGGGTMNGGEQRTDTEGPGEAELLRRERDKFWRWCYRLTIALAKE